MAGSPRWETVLCLLPGQVPSGDAGGARGPAGQAAPRPGERRQVPRLFAEPRPGRVAATASSRRDSTWLPTV